MVYKYYSAGNTPIGFVNHFNTCMDFEGASQILYIKGGSGIGKSTLMRKVASVSQDMGLDTHEIYCSSDKNSLDGIVVDDLGIALFDATMPHISDPIYPRINGRIVDLGVFLDESVLKSHRDEVIALIHDKKACYRTLYSLLGTLTGIMNAIVSSIEYDSVALARIRHEILSSIDGHSTINREGFLSVIDKDGYLDMSEGIIDDRRCYQIVSETHIIATHLVDEISRSYTPTSHERYWSLLEPNIVETMATDSEIITASTRVQGDIIYNIDNVVNIKNRHTYSILCDIRDEILALASTTISDAQSIHASIENIYKSAMDYDMLEDYQNRLVRELFEVK